MKLVCENCGSDKVQSKVWADANTDIVMDSASDGEWEDNWCTDCADHCFLTDEEEYLKKKLEED